MTVEVQKIKIRYKTFQNILVTPSIRFLPQFGIRQ